MFLRFIGQTDMESWARDYRLEVTATDDGPVVTGISGHICQYTDDLLAVTIADRWVSARQKLITAGCVVVQATTQICPTILFRTSQNISCQ